MILTDAGPLIALINRNDPHHRACVSAASRLPAEPLLTTWPCFTEAMYLLFHAGGHRAQAELWRWRREGRLVLHDVSGSEIDRMEALMDKYRDRPMDLGDASIVAAAERLGTKRLFTLDGDFRIYRLAGDAVLQCIP